MKAKPGKASVNLLTVAREAGVSRATASLVLRQSPLVATATRDRVQDAMKRLGYIYNRGAANLRHNRTGTVGLVLPNMDNPFFGALTAGVEEANDLLGTVCFIANSGESADRQARQIQRLREHNVDGIILCPAIGSGPDLVGELSRLRLPFVQVLRRIPVGDAGGMTGDYVAVDYGRGVAQAMERLVESGRRRIAYVGNMTAHSAGRARLEAYLAFARRFGIGERYVVSGKPDNRYDEAAMDRLLDSPDAPDAAICFNDVIALDLSHHLRRLGRRVGEAFAVIGMDDLPQAAAAFPPLATIATRPREVGLAAARRLHARIERPDLPFEEDVIPPRLILRASFGASAAEPQGG
ncbi:LacI family DNA-binding transcriptional regulator [Swaminathania salitolerans]|uniref:LacI family transcriptional regulator n=1 Tax=Swaminathania salitolerans TaxID=182838 RepID=A0A511BQ27_9PROT|nr:LacI family DNA-binding transcriptional regulator [Swaminathania salitolerans]GBQ14954.1 LacI family transcriptional regulator [Swaminathania salitolerans LMG 21291]GEL01943.1 LacI family transcriptional regulator [Swaminathania salitolerans]